MRRKKSPNRTVLILGGIFIIFANLILLQRLAESQTEQRLLAEVPGDPLIPGITRDDIQAVRIQVPGSEQSFTVARDGAGTWTAPGYTSAFEPAQGESIAVTVSLIPYYRRLENAVQGDRGTYGFTPLGSLLIQVVLRDGRQYAVAVGDLTPSGDTYYVILDRQPDVYIVERRAIDFLFVQMRDATA
jgi:hypothetical protein